MYCKLKFAGILVFLGFLVNFIPLELCGNECVVFVSNKKYFPKFLESVSQLVTQGNYHGDICLVIGDDLLSDSSLNHPLIIENKIVIKHFPDLPFPLTFFETFKKAPPPFNEKLFQYHKLYLFYVYFKQWDTIFYIDSGMKIYQDIRPILDTKKANTLLAHSDAYPAYEWKLAGQFNKDFPDIFYELNRKYNLDIDYFQTTIMLFDTSIIQEDTFRNIYNLTLEYPISQTNDQGMISLYFTNIFPVWEQIPTKNEETFFYDFLRRDRNNKYIMLKY